MEKINLLNSTIRDISDNLSITDGSIWNFLNLTKEASSLLNKMRILINIYYLHKDNKLDELMLNNKDLVLIDKKVEKGNSNFNFKASCFKTEAGRKNFQKEALSNYCLIASIMEIFELMLNNKEGDFWKKQDVSDLFEKINDLNSAVVLMGLFNNFDFSDIVDNKKVEFIKNNPISVSYNITDKIYLLQSIFEVENSIKKYQNLLMEESDKLKKKEILDKLFNLFEKGLSGILLKKDFEKELNASYREHTMLYSLNDKDNEIKKIKI